MSAYVHSKTCLQGTPQYTRESIPTSQVYLHHRCPFITDIPSSQVSLHHKYPFITGIPTSQVHKRSKKNNTFLINCSLIIGCPILQSVPCKQVLLHVYLYIHVIGESKYVLNVIAYNMWKCISMEGVAYIMYTYIIISCEDLFKPCLIIK